MIHIEQIRQELTWKQRRDVLYPAEPIQNMRLAEDDDGIHFGAFKNNKIVAVVSLFQKGTDCQFRKLAVDTSVQNTGIGSSLLAYITAQAQINGGARIWCNARMPATGFYLKAGFAASGYRFSKNGVDYQVMEKAIAPAASQ